MQKEDNVEQGHTKWLTVDLESFRVKNLEDFVSIRSNMLFQMMELPAAFLDVDSDMWESHEDFQQALEKVHAIKVVNDHAERGVALIKEYNGLMTKDESQLQILLQVIEQHLQVYPDCKKQTLTSFR